jgi:hypothetical protein
MLDESQDGNKVRQGFFNVKARGRKGEKRKIKRERRKVERKIAKLSTFSRFPHPFHSPRRDISRHQRRRF